MAVRISSDEAHTHELADMLQENNPMSACYTGSEGMLANDDSL
jgi:hypothetical protein